MALSLITDIPATCYTSQLQKIELASSGTVVKFRIYYQAQLYYSGNGQTLIFSSSYNTRFSRVAIYDIGSLLETYLSDKDGLQQFIFYFSNGTDSLEQTYGIIYCKQLPLRTAADLANSNYITNYFNRLVYKGAKDQLPYFAGFGSPGGYAVRTITYTVVYRKTDGTFGTYDIISGGRTGFGISYVLTSCDAIAAMFQFSIPDGAVIVAYSLKQGSCTARFYVSEQPLLRQFKNDIEAMSACDACVLVLPCGRSAHAEAGWFAGKGKPVYVLITDQDSFEPELMYKLFTKVCISLEELINSL